MVDTDDEAIKKLAIDLGDTVGHVAYSKLCDEWKIKPSNQLEAIFRAAFVAGAHSAMSAMMDTDP